MATLKWSNVTGDETNAGASTLKDAGSLFSKAFENFSGAVEGRKTRETKSNTEQVLNQIRGIGTVEDFDAQSGQLGDLNAMKAAAGGNLDTSAISKALQAKVPALREEETRLRNELIGQIPNQIIDANLPGAEGALDYKGQVARVTQQVRDAGGSAGDVQKSVAALKSQLDERASLSPQAQVAVQQNAAQQDILTEQASQQLTAARDEALAKNPVSHTLNAEGNAISVGNVYDKIRKEYPQGSFWGGTGGDELQELIGKYELNGITESGSVGIKVGDEFKEGTVEVKPWMYAMAMDIAGQTKEDAFGSPTVTDKLFKDTLRDLAFDPQYKNMAANAARAKRVHDAGQTQLKLNRLKQGAQFSKDVKSSESARLLQQLQNAAN